MGALAYANRKRRTSESPRRIQAALTLVRRRLRCCQQQQGRVGRVPAAYAGSPATAMGGGRVAWDIGNDRT